jgi:hypothetical protein
MRIPLNTAANSSRQCLESKITVGSISESAVNREVNRSTANSAKTSSRKSWIKNYKKHPSPAFSKKTPLQNFPFFAKSMKSKFFCHKKCINGDFQLSKRSIIGAGKVTLTESNPFLKLLDPDHILIKMYNYVLWIRIRICMFLGLPDPLVTTTDSAPDLSKIKQT